MLCAAVVLAVGLADAYGQWPQFRGPNGSGVDAGGGYPVAFSPASNVVWKATIPYGQSSPIVVGNRIYVTASDGGKLLTIALDAATGREAWRRELKRARDQKVYHANDPASPTPAADADGVVAFFPDYGLAAYSADGTQRWTMPLGPFKSFYGLSASPIIAGDLVVLLCDQRAGSFLLALDRKTGSVRWKKNRPGVFEGWATPMVFRPSADAPAQLIVTGTTRIDSLRARHGRLPVVDAGRLQRLDGHSGRPRRDAVRDDERRQRTEPARLRVGPGEARHRQERTALHQEFQADKEMGEHFGWVDENGDDAIDAQEWQTTRMAGLGESGAIAIRAGTISGKIDPASVAWRAKKNLPYVPAPLLYKDVFYLVKKGGIITSLDSGSGRVLKEGRSPDAPGDYYASPIAADDKVYVASVDGKVTVLKAGGEWQVLGVNDLSEAIHATPALAGGRIYVRTRGAVYCFGAK